MTIMRTSIHGRRLGLGPDDELISNELQLTQPTVDATITVGAEVADARAITVQLKNARGENLTSRQMVDLVVLLDSGGADFVATGGSTGIAIGANGKLLAIVAKKYFVAISDATGLLTLTWTDTGTEAAFLGVRLNSGRIVISSALTNA